MDGELVFARAGFGSRAIPYLDAWELQRQLHERRVRGDIPDTCLLLEHPPVYTAGRRTDPLDRPVGDPGAPVIDVDRGGKITWHGLGQLVGYPILRLSEPVDVTAYVRVIEEALIRTCADFGVTTTRVAGRSGVWVPAGTGGAGAATPNPRGGLDRKVGAIGIRIARGVSMHGFSLNCDCDLSWFDRIVPCGISDATVTTISAEAGRPVTVATAADVVQHHLADVLGARQWRGIVGLAGLLPSAQVPSAAAAQQAQAVWSGQ